MKEKPYLTAYKAAHNIPLAASEVVEWRTRTSKTFRLPDGQAQTIFHGKSVHYEKVEGGGEWLDITLNVGSSEREGYDWQVAANRFQYYFKNDHDQPYPILASFKGHDLHQKIVAVCHYDPVTDKITILQQAKPTTLVVDGHHLRYNGVFTGVDLEYVVDTDFCRGFLHISEQGKIALRNAIQQQGLNSNGWIFFATKLDLDNYDLTPDVKVGDEYTRPVRWKDVANKALHWFVPDVARDEAGNEQSCRLKLFKHPTLGWLLFTALPLNWLKDSVGAITIDPPTDYYGETADGYIYGRSATYSVARSTSYGCYSADAVAYIGQNFVASEYIIYRGYLSFDTSAIPDDATVTAATLYVCADADESTTDFLVRCYRYAWVEALCTNQEANYDGAYGAGATLEGTLRDTAAGWVAGTYYNLAVATAGINKTGDTKYDLVSSRDVAGTVPTGLERVQARTADYADTTSDPYLSITYSLTQTLQPTGIASAEAFGTATIKRGTVKVYPTGIPSAQAFGTATIQRDPVTLSPTGIASAVAFGLAVIISIIAPTGIPSSEAFGNPIISIVEENQICPSGIASEEAFGTATLQCGVVTIAPTGIDSAEAFGTAQLIHEIKPTGIASEEAFGTHELLPGAVIVEPTGIASEEAFGDPVIIPSQVLEPTGIASEEVFGTAHLIHEIEPAGIASEEVFGAHVLQPGPVTIDPTGIASEEAFGTHVVLPGAVFLQPTGIASEEAVGSPNLLQHVAAPKQTWLNVYDTSGNLKARIFECPISECSTRSNTFGLLRFPIHQDAQGRAQLVKRRWVEVYHSTRGTIWSGSICHVKKLFDENGDPTRYYEVTARSFEWLPYWRRMVPATGQDYFFKSGSKVDDAVKYLVRYSMVSGYASAARAIAGFTVAADIGQHADIKTLAGRYEDWLGDKLEVWAKAYDLDWWVDADCSAVSFVFRTKVPRRGMDKSSSVVFTVGRHNLLALEYYEDDLDTAQLCYVGGPGEGATQVIHEVYDGAEPPTGWNRREMYIPLSNAEYTDELEAGGHAWLDSFGDTLTGVRFEFNETEAAKWRINFDIGDLVTVYDADFGVDKVAEIKETNYTRDEDGTEHIELLVGEPQPSKWDMLQAGMGMYSSFDDDSVPANVVGLGHTL